MAWLEAVDDQAALLEVRADAIQWEREGLPAGAKGHSYSVPSVMGVQYGVCLARKDEVVPPPVSEITELKEMPRRQQEQLT